MKTVHIFRMQLGNRLHLWVLRRKQKSPWMTRATGVELFWLDGSRCGGSKEMVRLVALVSVHYSSLNAVTGFARATQ